MRKLALVLLLVACGDDGVRHTPDASPHDGPQSPDARDIDAPGPAAVTIAAIADGQPVAGVHVYFLNADSTVVLATTTDATGTAAAVMAAGGSVTAIDPFTPFASDGQSDELDTVVGVKPGDHLLLSRSIAPATITVTVQAPDAGAIQYTAYSSCNRDGQPLQGPPQTAIAAPVTAQMTLTSCGATTDFLIVGSDTQGNLSSIYAPSVAVSDGGTVDLTASTYSAGVQRMYTLMNVPGLRSVSLDDELIAALGPIYGAGAFTSSDTINPTATASFPAIAGAGSVLEGSYQGAGGLSSQIFLDWGPFTSTYTTDVGARALYNYNVSPAYDVTTHTASVGEDTTTGRAPDFSAFALVSSRDTRSWTWEVIAPYSAQVVVPTVPTDLFDFNVGSGDSPGMARWVTGKVPGGYDAVRARFFTTNGPEDLALGSAGSAELVMSQLTLTRRWTRPGDTLVGHAASAGPRTLRHRVR